MNKIYIIAPVVLCAIFIGIYVNFAKNQEIKQKAIAEQVAATKRAEDEKKKEAEAKARADADARAKKRADDEKQKEADRRAKYEAVSKEIADATAKYNADADKYAKQAAELEIQLGELRKKKDTATREEFELRKQVELAQIAKRNAELEIQRMTKMIADKAAASALARPPAPPAVAKAP